MLTIEILDQSNNLTRKPSDNLYELPRIANYRHNDSRTSLLDEGIHHLKRAYVVGDKFQLYNIVEIGVASHKKFIKTFDYGRIQFRENPFKIGWRAKKSTTELTLCGDIISKECLNRCFMTTTKQRGLFDEDTSNHGHLWE